METFKRVKLLPVKVFSDPTHILYLNFAESHLKGRMMLEFKTVFWLSFSLKFEVYPIKGPDDVACNYNEDYSLIDFFTDDAPELTDTQESWTDYYDNLDSTDVVEGVTSDVIDASEPPEEDGDDVIAIEGEDGPTEENEDEDLVGQNDTDETEEPNAKSKFPN